MSITEWLVRWLTEWIVDAFPGWSYEWMDGWTIGWVDGWMCGWLAGWLAGWMDGWFDWFGALLWPFYLPLCPENWRRKEKLMIRRRKRWRRKERRRKKRRKTDKTEPFFACCFFECVLEQIINPKHKMENLTANPTKTNPLFINLTLRRISYKKKYKMSKETENCESNNIP